MWPFKKKPKPIVVGYESVEWAAPWGSVVWVVNARYSDGSEYTVRDFTRQRITFGTKERADEWARVAFPAPKEDLTDYWVDITDNPRS